MLDRELQIGFEQGFPVTFRLIFIVGSLDLIQGLLKPETKVTKEAETRQVYIELCPVSFVNSLRKH